MKRTKNPKTAVRRQGINRGEKTSSRKKQLPSGLFTRGLTISTTKGPVTFSGPNTEVIQDKERSVPVKKIIIMFLLGIFTAGLITTGWLGWKFYDNIAKLTGDYDPLSLFSLLDPAPLTQINGRVNILLAGDSSDDPGHQGADLTDSIMIISIDPVHKTAFLLSIPRDMWVDIPGHGYQKINSAYEDGGMALLSQVTQSDFGIQTSYYALIDYTAFRDAVNAVGGITININSSDPRGLYDPGLLPPLPNGPATLNGQLALDLARARGDQYGSYGFPASDFDRTQNQREMLVALKTKATTLGVVTNPVKIGQLFDAVGNNVVTNMGTSQLSSLYKITKGIPNNNIQSISLNSFNGKDLVTGYLAPDGEDALIPVAGLNNYSQIQAAIGQLLSVSANS